MIMMSDDASRLSSRIRELAKELGRLKKLVSVTTGKQLWSVRAKAEMRDCVLLYFREIKSSLATLLVDTDELDARMNALFVLTDKDATLATYKDALGSLERELHKIELASEVAKSGVSPVSSNASRTSQTEERIVQTLQGLIPPTALSYQQVLQDIQDGKRISFRGTAAELREVLRETLDHLAPDEQVCAEAGFKLEKDRTKPTMRQKARYILRSRGKASGSIDVPEKSITIVEETVAGLIRSTYDRGSVETHTQSGISKPALLQLKMYVDSVLSELLEIHQR